MAVSLEGARKAYGLRIQISDSVRNLAGDALAVREIDAIRMKGKEAPTPVFEPLEPNPDGETAKEPFALGLDYPGCCMKIAANSGTGRRRPSAWR